MNLLTDKQKIFDLWAPLYDVLFPSVFYQAVHKRLLEYVELPESPNVLDMGCGTGRLLNRLAAKYPDLQGTGLDFSAEMLRQARCSNHHRPRLIFVEGTVAPLPFADEQFDAVFNSFSFLHYAEPEQVFAEVYRVLQPGGRFYLVDPTTKDPSGIWHIPASSGGIRFYSPQMRQHMGTQAGFTWLQHQYLLGPTLLTLFAKEC
jgi:ubiquinone/menaquinone biosynthesis C-methylase UbiE